MRIGVGLSIPELATRGGRFSPASLFTGGVQGAWYAPDDFSTLFQDSAGTTPVTAVEQPVGLMLDKSQGLVLGSELVTNGDFATSSDWTLGSGWTISGGAAVATSAASGATVIQIQTEFVSGRLYKFTYTVVSVSAGGFSARFEGQTGTSRTTPGTYTEYFFSTGATQNSGVRANGTTTGSITNISVKELPGNHASQATAASRPVLRARYNLLTKTENLSDATQWTIANATLAAVTDGFSLTGNAGTSVKYLYAVNTVVAGSNVYKIYVKNVSHQFVQLSRSGSVTEYANFDLTAVTAQAFGGTTASITEDADGFMLCSITFPLLSNNSIMLSFADSLATTRQAASASVGVIYVKKPSLLPANQSTLPYQRVNTATDYATAGFLPYLYFVTDDSFGTNSIDFTGTNAMSVVTGYTKLSDTAVGMLYELGIDPTTTNGTFNFVAPQSTVDGSYRINVRGTTTVQVNTAARAAPVTDVSSLQANIAGPSISLRLNGAVAASSTSSMGTGNFANSALYIGRRNNSNFPINGNFYQMVICGKALSASELASTEAYVATKTGVVI